MMQQSEPPPPECAALPDSAWTPPPPPTPLSRSRSSTAVTLDIVGTVLLSVILIFAAASAAIYSLFFIMITDSCFGGTECNVDLVTQGTATVWIGSGVALLTALIGTVVCAAKRRYMFCWPLIGIVIVMAAMWIGVSMAEAGGPQH